MSGETKRQVCWQPGGFEVDAIHGILEVERTARRRLGVRDNANQGVTPSVAVFDSAPYRLRT